jgi:glutamyl-tRNA reductase
VSVVVIGLNHHTAPLELLERMSLDGDHLSKILRDLTERPNVSEAVVLSTCNRTEVYAVAEKFHGAYDDVRESLGLASHLPLAGFADHLSVFYDDDCARHLFEVAGGLDSAVLGEAEVLGQVRTAWDLGRAEGTCGPGLNLLFRHALETGKRARTETAIGRSIASASTAAVAMAARHLGDLAGRRALVLGAGEMGEGMVRALVTAGVTDVEVANRTHGRAAALAERVGGRPISLDALPGALAAADLMLTGTGASDLMLEHGALARIMEARSGRPLLVVDVAVPPDVDPAAGRLDGVTLLDMDDLKAFAADGLATRRAEVTAVRSIVDQEVERWSGVATAREVAPLVGSLHERAEQIRRSELDRSRARLAQLDERSAEAVEALTRSIVAKLLHEPTIGLKGAAGTPRGERLAEAARDLFDL